MANSTDPFGRNVFGGQTSIRGGASATPPTTATATAKAAPYKYLGQGWNDPLAQQMYQKYAFGGRLSPEFIQQKVKQNAPMAGPHPGLTFNDPMDPTGWGGWNQGADVDRMKAAYIAAGGQGTYEQLAATNPEAVGWKAGQGRINTMTGQMEYPQATGGWSSTLTSAGAPAGGSGSMNALPPDVLKKMWR
jgi:hypothetical protein